MSALRVITCHGLTWHEPGYAKPLATRLESLLGPLRLVEVNWSSLSRWGLLAAPLYHFTRAGQRARTKLGDALYRARLSASRTILVCHSFGTVLAMDIGVLPVDLLVTMDMRVGVVRPFAGPTGPKRWLNLAARGSWLGCSYSTRGLAAMDQEVDLGAPGRFGLAAHRAFWRSPEVADRIATAWKA